MGNRQQSRFLALVSSYDRLKELSAIAADSENTSQLQYLKTLDSVEAKQQQLKTSMQSLYIDTGIEQSYKAGLDFANNYVKMLNKMGTGTSGFLKAISQIGMTFYSIANVVTTVFGIIRTRMQVQIKATGRILELLAKRQSQGLTDEEENEYKTWRQIQQRKLRDSKTINQQLVQDNKDKNNQMTADDQVQATGWRGKLQQAGNWIGKHKASISMGLSMASLGASAIAANQQDQRAQGVWGTASTALSGASMGLMMGGGVWGAAAGAIGGLVLGIIQNASKIWQSEADKLKDLQEKAAEANNKALEKQADTKALNTQIEQLRKLEAARYDSVEAEEAYYEAANQMAEKYPNLILSLDSVGNATIDLKAAELELKDIREASVKATKDAAIAEYKAQIQSLHIAHMQTTGTGEGLGQYIEKQQVVRTGPNPLGRTYAASDITQGGAVPSDQRLRDIYEGLVYGATIKGKYYTADAIDLNTILEDPIWSNLLNSIDSKSLSTDLDKAMYEYFIQFLPGNQQNSQVQSEYLKQLARTLRTRKAGIIQTIGSINAGKEKKYSYLTEMSIAGDLLGEIGKTSYWEYAKEKEQTDLSDVDLYGDYLNVGLEEYIDAANESLQTFWTEILSTDELRSQFNELTRDRKTITRKEMLKALGKFTTDSGLITNLLNAMYGFLELGALNDPERVSAERERQERMKDARDKRTQRKIKDNQGQEKDNPLNLALTQSDEFWAGLTEYENAQILAFYDPLQKQVDNGQISWDRAQGILNQYMTLAQLVQKSENELAEKIFYGWTDWTRAGIQLLAKKLQEQGVTSITDQDITNFANSVVYNIDTVLLQIEKTISDAVKNYEEAFSQATSGMSTDKALKFAAKNGFDLSQLELRNGKWYADSALLLGEIHQNFIETYEAEKKSYDEVINENNELLKLRQPRNSDWREHVQNGGSIFDDDLLNSYPMLRAQSKQFLDVYEKFLKDENSIDYTFELWLQAKTENIEAMQDAERYAYGDALLQNGHVTEFVALVKQFDGVDYKDWDDIVKAYKNNELPEAMKMYEGSIKKYLEQSLTPVYDAASRLLSGQSQEEGILVTSKNKDLLNKIASKLDGKEWEEGQTAYLTIEDIRKGWLEIVAELGDDAALSLRQKREYAAKLWNSQFLDNAFDTFNTAISSWDKMDFSTWLALPEAMQKIVDFTNSSTGKGILDLNQAAELLTSDYLMSTQKLTAKLANEVRASLLKAQREQSAVKILPDIIKNREKLSEDNIESLANLLKIPYDKALKEIHAFRNDDGTYRVDVSRIRELMHDNGIELTNEMELMIAESLQDSITDVQDAIRGVSTGYTNLSDMQKLMNQFEQAGMGLSFDLLFTFDESLGAYFISALGLFRQLVLARQQLEGGTALQQAAAQQLINDVDRQLKLSIDISNLISASTIDKKTSDNFSRAVANYNTYLLAMGKETQYNATALQDALLLGGQVGIEAAQAIAEITGKELSAEDIATLYKKPAERMRTAMERLTAGPGAIIDKTTAELIQIGGGAVDYLGNGAYKVTQSATDLFAAYGALYNSLEATGQATIEELNNIVAKAYESKEKADVTSMMSGLTDMTYSTLANIFTAAGQRLTPRALQSLQLSKQITSLGAGKLRINNFETFAKAMGVDPTSEAYISAFRTYNDEMIKINQLVSTNIKNAANEVLGAQVGTLINLTDMYARLDYDGQQALIETLHTYGATLENGILTIGDTAHLPEIYGEIVSLGAEVGALTEADIHEMNKNILKYHREHDPNARISQILSEMDKSTEDTIEMVALVLGTTFDKAALFFTLGENGYYKLDRKAFVLALLHTPEVWEKLSLSNKQAIENITSTQIDAAISMLNSVTSQNYTSMEDMRTVVNKLNLLGTDGGYLLTVDAIFDFDEVLNSWRLNVYGIEALVTAALAELKAAGASLKQIQGFQQRTLQTFARNIDAMGYINSADKGIDGEALRQAIELYNAAARAFDDQLGINADALIDSLNAGGIDAMNALTILSTHTGQKFSSADYLAAYQAGTEKFTEAFNSLHLSIGEIISDEAAEVLGLSGKVTQIQGTGHSLITNTVDLINSYDRLIARLANDPRTTLAQFNEAVVGKYEAEATSERTLASISNGMLDMNSFKERMTQLGYRVNDVMQAAINARIANIDKASGNIKILDFDRFATEVLQISIWDKDGRYTQAYLDAKKAWNDAVIADITKTSDVILSELNNLSNAQAGDYVNISTIWNSIAQTEQGGMAEILEAFGAEVRDGILYLSDRAAAQLPYITLLLVNSSGLYQTSQGNTLIANARKQARESSVDNLYLDILKSRESLNEDNLLAIAQMFGVTYDSVAGWLEAAKQGDGTYKLSVADVEALFEGRGLSDATKEFAKELIGSIIDNTISSLSGISTKVFNTSLMQATIKDLNSKVKGGSFETSDLFEFNKLLGGYVLTTKGVYAQFKIAAAEAAKAGPEAQRLLLEQAQDLLGDISITELITSLQQGNRSEQYATKRAFKLAIDKYNAAMQALGRDGLDSNILLLNLEQGGLQALAAARVIARAQGKKLSDSDITAIYQSHVNQLMQASDLLLNAGVGAVISSTAADILGYAKFGSQRLEAGGAAVLESADDLIDAYSKLYDELEHSGVATLAQLNQTMSRKLAKTYDKNHGINGVDYLSKAASLTYEEFGEMFTAAGVKLTDTMFEDLLNREIITETGGGTLRIENFDYIAKSLGIEQGSLAYTKAFKAYNDSLIKLDTEVTNNILDEVKSVANAQTGKKSKINLTQLYTELDNTALGALQYRLYLYGGLLNNGILTIHENANIPALVQSIMSVAEANNLLLESELALLADTLNEIIRSYAESIAKALSGGLTNSEAATLTAQAKTWFGIDINFTKTYDGLKLSTDQANHLYQSLKLVDATAANIVFEPLKESLTSANESLSSASGLAAAISKAEGQLADAADGTNQVLQERIALYKEIQVAQIDSAESYNFMGRSLPLGMQGVKNYWDSWGTAFKTLNEIAKEQNRKLKPGEIRKDPMLKILDFYNMVTEMNNLAAISGEIEFLGYKLDGSLESASKLINAGLSAISNVDGEGAKINLNQFAVDFSTGVAGMGKNIDKGIKEMAESQIEMLDGLIQFLETVVAMEKLSNLDANHDNAFEFKLIFDWDEFTKEATANKKAAEDAAKIIEDADKKGNEELKKSLLLTKINGISIYKMLQDLAGGAKLSKEQALLYTTALSGLYQQLMTGDYDPNKLGDSVMQAMMNSTVPLELQYGDKRVLFSQGVQLEWDEKNSQWRAPDGTLLGSDGPAAIAKLNKKRDAATVSAMLKGDTGDMTIELDDRTITVTQGLTLVANDNGLFYANGEYYNTPEQASAALAKGTRFDLEQDLQHTVTWTRQDKQGNDIEMKSLQGYTAEIQMDKYGKHWVDTKSGRSYDSEEAWYQGEVLSSLLNFGKAHVAWELSNYDEAKKTTTVEIKYGYGIQVTMDANGLMTYKVGNEDNLTRNQATLKAEKLAYNDLSNLWAFKNKANFLAIGYAGKRNKILLIAALKYGIVTEIEEDGVHKYKIGSKTYDNIDEAYSALSKLLFNKDGTLKDQKSLFSGVRGVFGIEVATEVKITNEDLLAHLPAETAQEVISKILNAKTHEEIEGIKKLYNLPLTIDWDVNEKDAGLTAGLKSQLISLLGGSFEMKALSLSATFNGENGDKLAKLLLENGIDVKVNLIPGTDTSGLGVGDSTTPEGLDDVTTVTLSALKVMVSQENIDWTAVSALIASVPEDKRPTVEALAKQYIVQYIKSKLLGGKISYEGIPTTLTALDGLTAPELIALATVLQVGLDPEAEPTPGAGLTQEKLQALADTLGINVTDLTVIISTLKVAAKLKKAEVDGSETSLADISTAIDPAVDTWIKTLFPDGNYTPQLLQTLTIIALVSGLLLSHKGPFTSEETTEDVTIPTDPKSKTSIKDLGVMVNALKLLYQNGAAGINSENIDTIVDLMVEKGTLTPAQALQFKVLVKQLLLAPQQGATLTPNVGDVVTLNADGSIDGGQLDMSIEVKPVFTITDEEKKFRELREQVLNIVNDSWDIPTEEGKPFTLKDVNAEKYYNLLYDRVFTQGKNLEPNDLKILDKWKTLLTHHKSDSHSTALGYDDNIEYWLNKIEILKSQSEQNTWDMTNNLELMSQAFKDIDLSQVNALNEVLNSIIENATALQNIPWDFLVSSINELNKIQIPELQVLNVNAIMRTIQANVTLDYGDDTIAEEVITKDIIERTLKLNLDDSEIQSLFERLKTLFDINVDVNTNPEAPPPTTNSDLTTYDGNLGDAADDLNKAGKAARELGSDVTDLTSAAEAYPTDAAGRVSDFGNATQTAGQTADRAATTVSGGAARASSAAYRVSNALNSIQSREIDIKLNIEAKSGDSKVSGTIDGKPINPRGATSVSLAGAKGNALATGTLMGELGPELVVSHGRYFVVGLHGAEMVNLAPDAIVFNHLQTLQLLKNKRTGRGTPTTNERNAVAYAKGSGPALASASEALATLKQIRTMWQSMLNASMKNLGAMAGLNKGSSGGGGGQDPKQIKAVIEEIERWYNLLRQIDKLEKDITYQESLQSKIESDRIANGQALYRSYKEELKALDGLIVRNQQLADLQQSWYERKRDEFTASDYGKIFRYNDKGLLQLQDGRDLGLDVLEKLTSRGIYGQTSGLSLNAKAQIDYLKSIGFDINNLKYNDDGTTIDSSSKDYKKNPDKIYEDMMQNFWDNLDGWKDELDSVYDSYHGQLKNVLSNETKRNQLLQKIIDNQLSVEQDVLKAIESREQKLIDELQDERDAFDKSNKDFLDGLNDQLNQLKQMYQNQESEKELVKLRRQLAILQRSGGSGSQIRSLQDQIAAKEQDQYFTVQLQQIANIQKAADLQIKRMDSQIELMTQTLEYQKLHGLLWQEVYEVMAATPEQIRQFIMENTPDFQSASALDVALKIRDIDLRINEWVAYRDDQDSPTMDNMFYDWDSYMKARSGKMGDAWSDELAAQAKSVFDEWLQKTGDINLAGDKADEILQEAWKKFHPDDKPIDFDAEGTDTTAQEEKKQQQYYKTYSSDHNTAYQDWLNQRQKTLSQSTKGIEQGIGAAVADKTVQQLEILQHAKKQSDQNSGMQSASSNAIAKQYNALVDTLPPELKKQYKKYASGGMVDYTGPAWVDGTPERPEAFLDSDTTRLVRQDLLGRSNSLLSFARDMVQQLHGASYSLDTNNVTEQNGLNIEKIDVNVKVDKVANDYDARAMGNTVMNEILSIARKSGTRGLSRR